MYIVGIDIGKNHHEASIVSPEGKQIGHSLRFATTHKGADSLMSFIFNNIGNSSCIFGMEATGHYWYPIYSFLKARGYTIYVINPIQSDSLRKMYIRQCRDHPYKGWLEMRAISLATRQRLKAHQTFSSFKSLSHLTRYICPLKGLVLLATL